VVCPAACVQRARWLHTARSGLLWCLNGGSEGSIQTALCLDLQYSKPHPKSAATTKRLTTINDSSRNRASIVMAGLPVNFRFMLLASSPHPMTASFSFYWPSKLLSVTKTRISGDLCPRELPKVISDPSGVALLKSS
jgi:hypothetical protein